MRWLGRQQHASAGAKLPPATSAVDEYYSAIDPAHRWQGDVYPSTAFPAGVMPSAEIPYWILLNRTCHLYEGEGRAVKLSHLNFCAVTPVQNFVQRGGKDAKSIKRQVSELIKNHEGVLFLPALAQAHVTSHLIVAFNLIHTIPLDRAPQATSKVLQLSSPFAEHAFQKFAAYFYTVGFSDERIKSPAFIAQIVADLERPPAAQLPASAMPTAVDVPAGPGTSSP